MDKRTNIKDGKSIENLRIYQSARQLEDQVFELIKNLPAKEQYGLANDLRRASAGVAHFISDAHKRYSYPVKIESLHCARTEAEEMLKLLAEHEKSNYGTTEQLREGYTRVVKQSWGLIKYLKNKQEQRQAAFTVQATDQLVATRS